MSFQQGDYVKIKGLKKSGTVVAVLKGGEYRVQVGSLVIKCPESKITLSEKPVEKSSRSFSPSHKEPKDIVIDLHGLTVEEALRVVEKTIDTGILDNAQSIKIIHGKGSGRIKNAVRSYAKSLRCVSECKEDLLNPGVTWVYL